VRVLVIGATGFIGTRVADELVVGHGADVRVTVRDYRKAIRLGRLPIEWVDAPASDPDRMRVAGRGCDAVVCCAHPFGNANENEVALAIARAAAAAAAETTTRRLVFLSSTSVYGTSGGDVNDDDVPNADTPYGAIKLRCEAELARAHDAGSIRLVVLRPSIVYGPFSPSWTSLPARQMLSGELVLPHAAAGACNAVYVDDVARAVVAAIALESSAPVTLNVTGPERLSWREFYGCYEHTVRPGSIVEWTHDAIDTAGEIRERERGGWRALKRAMRDQAVRERLNEIPVLSRLNQLGKSLGWSGLPPAAAPAPAAAATPARPALVSHLPPPMLLDLYLRAPYIGSARAAGILGVRPRSLADGMAPTLEWLRWAGLTAESTA
jgi:nucleoside-diphosphate-sugar epimerase